MKKNLSLKGAAILALACALFFAACKEEDSQPPHELPDWLVGTWSGLSQRTDSASFTIRSDLSFDCTLNFKINAVGNSSPATSVVHGQLAWFGLEMFEYMMTNMTVDSGGPAQVENEIGRFSGLTAKFIPSGNSFLFVGTTPILGAIANQFFGGTYTKQ
jgi:hypothetical protein